MGFTLMLGHRLGDNREDMELRRRRRSAEDTYPWGDDTKDIRKELVHTVAALMLMAGS